MIRLHGEQVGMLPIISNHTQSCVGDSEGSGFARSLLRERCGNEEGQSITPLSNFLHPRCNVLKTKCVFLHLDLSTSEQSNKVDIKDSVPTLFLAKAITDTREIIARCAM